MKTLRLDGLFDNQIGDAGLTAFSTAVASGALANLSHLWIDTPSVELTAYCSLKSIQLNPW